MVSQELEDTIRAYEVEHEVQLVGCLRALLLASAIVLFLMMGRSASGSGGPTHV